ncbi:hypothetical protein [Tindallia californiensis]|uniref:YceG-like family protein n=1 Tax=Tindallia californiensis TaxID=159292 RepID=A0A1H3IC30_9FIRM|nr:hypothetical protein [Tindallia californiensis]SDY24819.1 hypothetical protein SAMN05192546_10184 [Tindallia californiensis]
MERLKDFIHDYSDLFLATLITASMAFVVFWNLNTIFDDSPSVANATPPSTEDSVSMDHPYDDSDELSAPDSDPVVIDLSPEDEHQQSDDSTNPEETDAADSESVETHSYVTIDIPSGTPGVGIANILVEAGLIENPGDFVQAAEELNLSLSLKSGTYDVPVSATPEQLVRIIAGQE